MEPGPCPAEGAVPAHYAVHITRPGRPLLCIGPYHQCIEADDASTRINKQWQNTGGTDATAEAVPFGFGTIDAYHDPHRRDIDQLVTDPDGEGQENEDRTQMYPHRGADGELYSPNDTPL